MKQMQLMSLACMLLIAAGCAQENASEPSNQEENPQTQTESNKSEDQPAEEQTENQQEKTKEDNKQENKKEDSEKEKQPKETGEGNGEESSNASKGEPVQVENPASTLVLVNKNHLLPADYKPADLVKPDVPFYFEEDLPKRYMREEAAAALEKVFEAAKSEGLNLVGASAYRSYDRQKRIYEANVESMGKEAADKVSAFPGASEHQTGLAIDVTSAEMGYGLDEAFGDTEEGKWLAEHAHQYGFIIRYPEGRTETTGYSYEPWHLRYVGKEAAKKVYDNNLVLEEYLK